MPDRPDIEERIEQIIQAHRPKRLRQRETEECQQGCLYISGGWYVHLSSVLVSELGLTREQRTLADGMGGVSTNYKTGETTVHNRPCTRQSRYVTDWKRL